MVSLEAFALSQHLAVCSNLDSKYYLSLITGNSGSSLCNLKNVCLALYNKILNC